jgi:hypothetical protein
VPFVEGRLRRRKLSVEIDTQCAHCGRTMRFVVDSTLKRRVYDRDSKPLLFEPEVNWETFTEPNIIHAY